MKVKFIIILFLIITVVFCRVVKTKSHQNSLLQNDTITTAIESKSGKHVRIDHTDSLIIYYPYYSRIDLVTGTMPDKITDTDVVFCCEAAYTKQCLNQFRHNNIAGDHVSSGMRYSGYPCLEKDGRIRNTGAFVWFDGKYKFLWQEYSHESNIAAEHGGMGFGQELMVHEGDILPTVRSDSNGPNFFRALCEVNGELCFIQCKQRMLFGSFKHLCKAFGAREALYLDMGEGWNHSWYRDEDGKAVDIFPKTHDFCTNWITFYR